jgi:carboxypeptidase Taq
MTIEKLKLRLREIALLGSAASVLHWDEQTYMPAAAAELRADQTSLMARLCHEQFTAAETGELLDELEAKLSADDQVSDSRVILRETRRDYDRATRLPARLVEELTRVSVLAQSAWIEARKESSYDQFRPWLDQILALKREEADCIGYEKQRYDALLDEFEPYETTQSIAAVFQSLRDPLIQLVGAILESGRSAPLEILQRSFEPPRQETLAREAAAKFGFDFKAGRLDISAHPFCSDIGPGDTRMTTRYDPEYFGDAFFGVLHETAHGLYDQGLPNEEFGNPLGEAVSLGIHESQSRMWENLVGRSRSFWRYFFPKVKAAFGAVLSDVSEEEWYRAVNDVRPSLIRTESDEVTYNLHILLRFELEQALLSGDLSTADLPGEWNGRMRHYLGIDPTGDADGCLQDIHWSGGSFGYFPTYTLGNLYAAQFFQAAQAEIPDLEQQFAHGDFGALLGWLRENIHHHGRRYSARELVLRATGRELSAEPLLNHLRKKAAELYGIQA